MDDIVRPPRYLDQIVFFFFQAEDGIRDGTVTGVQTCALPISSPAVGAALTICCVWEVLMSWQVTAAMTGGGEPLAQPPLGVRVLAGPPLPGRQPVRVQVIRDQVRAGPLHVRGVGPESFGDLLQLGGQLRLSCALPV